ncbi:MAG: BatA domain-containing protein [Firmicutes bacterium]|nr:BatA domain-containing protein [Bacillota bacterium]
MSLLLPLGLIALASLAVLILIYIIKPAYQKRFVSSTFIWKQALKRKKKRIPISRLRNILIFLCQFLILTTFAFAIAQPFIADAQSPEQPHLIIVIDAGVSMRTRNMEGDGSNALPSGSTRFWRAVEGFDDIVGAREEGINAINDGAAVSVIIAGHTPFSLVTSAIATSQLETALNSLHPNNEIISPFLEFGEPNIERAMRMIEDILTTAPLSDIIYFTSIDYEIPGNVEVRNVSNAEWNVAILGVEAIRVDGLYEFHIEIASFGRGGVMVPISLQLDDVNTQRLRAGYWEVETYTATLNADEIYMAVIRNFGPAGQETVYSFGSATVSVDVNDSFQYDNQFVIFGGRREVIHVQYVAPEGRHHLMMNAALIALRTVIANQWDVVITTSTYGVNFEEGYTDVYIFEHEMPAVLPQGGIVILLNPGGFGGGIEGVVTRRMPSNVDMELGSRIDGGYVTNSNPHPMIAGMNVNNIRFHYITEIRHAPMFAPIMFVEDNPILLVQNTLDAKVVIMPINLHYANFRLAEWPSMLLNLFEYFLPVTLPQHVFDVNQTFEINPRGGEVGIVGPGLTVSPDGFLQQFPQGISMSVHGVHTISQSVLGRINRVEESLFIRIARDQSDFVRVGDSLPNPLFPPPIDDLGDWHLLIFIAAAFVALLFIERLLHLSPRI